MTENLKNFKRKKSKFSLVLNPLTSQNWPGALDYLALGLVDNKYTKLRKIGEKVLLILRLAHRNLPLS